MIVCYQYNFTDGRTEFINSRQVTDGMVLFCDNPKYVGYPVCAWKTKSFIGNASMVMQENSFFMQDKPLIEFLNTVIKNKNQ